MSGRLDNAVSIASFGYPLEPLQQIVYARLDQLAAKCFEHPSQPTWRESEVSARLHETEGDVERGAGGGLIVGDAQSSQNPLDLILFGIHRVDLEHAVPPHRFFQIDHLAG